MNLNSIHKTLEVVPMDKLKPYPGNPRHNNKSAAIVAKSIERFGYINPIVVDENYIILAGNTRFKAMKLLNQLEVEVLRVDGLSDADKHSFVIIDNRSAEFSKWNATAMDRMTTNLDMDNAFLREFGISNIADTKKDLEAMLEL